MSTLENKSRVSPFRFPGPTTYMIESLAELCKSCGIKSTDWLQGEQHHGQTRGSSCLLAVELIGRVDDACFRREMLKERCSLHHSVNASSPRAHFQLLLCELWKYEGIEMPSATACVVAMVAHAHQMKVQACVVAMVAHALQIKVQACMVAMVAHAHQMKVQACVEAMVAHAHQMKVQACVVAMVAHALQMRLQVHLSACGTLSDETHR